MKKLIFVLFVLVSSLFIGCADLFVQCPNERYCDNYDSCCPVSYPYACGGLCYTTEAAAILDCGRFGNYVDDCYVE
jgi:hypothetical protein